MSVLLPTVPQTRMLRMSSPALARSRWSRHHSSIALRQPGPRNRKTRCWPETLISILYIAKVLRWPKGSTPAHRFSAADGVQRDYLRIGLISFPGAAIVRWSRDYSNIALRQPTTEQEDAVLAFAEAVLRGYCTAAAKELTTTQITLQSPSDKSKIRTK